MELPNKQGQELIDQLTIDLQPLVDDIHKQQALTQNYYGDYMNIISQCSGGNRNKSILIAIALIKAGANVRGVESAMKILIGL